MRLRPNLTQRREPERSPRSRHRLLPPRPGVDGVGGEDAAVAAGEVFFGAGAGRGRAAGEGREGGVGEEGGGGVLGDGSGDFAGGFGGRGAHFFFFLLGGLVVVVVVGGWGVGVGLLDAVGVGMVLMWSFGVCDLDREVLSETDGKAIRCS